MATTAHTPAPGEITHNFHEFVALISVGEGWICRDDVQRQWEGLFGASLTPDLLGYLLGRMETTGLLR